MIQEKVLNNPNLLGMGVSQYFRVSRRCPTLDQNSIFFLEVDPIPFLVLSEVKITLNPQKFFGNYSV